MEEARNDDLDLGAAVEETRPGGAAVSLRAVTKTYNIDGHEDVHAVRLVNLAIRPGEFVLLSGRSGSGKTTLLHLAAGLLRPTSGSILVDGTDLGSLDDRGRCRFRNRTLGFVFQFPSLLPSLDALENVALPASYGFVDRDKGMRRAETLLRSVGLGNRLHSLPRQLSAGQQKRVVIARALLNRPRLLLADEPTADLDERTEEEIMSLLRAVHEKTGMTVLVVTHSRNLDRYGSRALEMDEGAIHAPS